MKIMTCPLNGPRNISEFSYGGEVRQRPAPGAAPEAVADYLFLKDNRAGITREWWCHVPTSYWFIAERDVVSDRILRTYPPSELITGEAGQ
ncbi:Sarcosine oxidase delta subunit [Rhodovastum atsumiense]|uniref:Sarcosine oxidase subunit delta n=1 Tax=Rhodovastum atsumiense TaxID=504468 RepID=A0A5M6IX65_9PROT|nr:sarcosine oxidase subunit delta [Rhodovastum atsumiense]KAA5612841.1 sarcosine oxidase subunit delta [Rhodovastum atsumiense]CAH2601094.1 Sarcosine oxidase delta subunit [Rhodovastum atsumiense]